MSDGFCGDYSDLDPDADAAADAEFDRLLEEEAEARDREPPADRLAQITETRGDAEILASWLASSRLTSSCLASCGDAIRRVSWLGRGSTLARVPDPDLGDAMFLKVDGVMHSVQSISAPAGPKLRVRRWSRAACRGARKGSALAGAWRIGKTRRTVPCFMRLIESPYVEGVLISIDEYGGFWGRRAGAQWTIGISRSEVRSSLMLPLIRSAEAESGADGEVTLRAIVASAEDTQYVTRRMMLLGDLVGWEVDRIRVKGIDLLATAGSVPACWFSPDQLDVGFVSIPIHAGDEIRVDLSRRSADLPTGQIVGAMVADAGLDSHLCVDLGMGVELHWTLHPAKGWTRLGDQVKN